MNAKLNVVICMDTEGPCDDPNDKSLLKNWDFVDMAMDKLFNKKFRNSYLDTIGNNFKIGWFFLTWTGFKLNPRNRDFGFHKVRDHYIHRWGKLIDEYGDEHCWHYHHPSSSKIGNEWGIDWSKYQEYHEIISRQILDRNWFPVCYRAGGTIMTPLSSRVIDAWFPIDYTNRAPLNVSGLVNWREGQNNWGVYHPDAENFLISGTGRRRMARSLDLETGLYKLKDDDIISAFEQVKNGSSAILSFFDHDYRDIYNRVENFFSRLFIISKKYPNVKWEYAAPAQAIRNYLDVPRQSELKIYPSLYNGTVRIWTNQPVYQSIPWIALRLKNGEVHHITENIIRIDETHWKWEIPQTEEWKECAFAFSTDLGQSAVTRIFSNGYSPDGFLERKITMDPLHPRAIENYSKIFPEICIKRVTGLLPEMDAVRQAIEILQKVLKKGDRILDVGCSAGHIWRSCKPYDYEYYGIDSYQQGIEIGKQYLSEQGLPENRLRVLELINLPLDERYDAVINLTKFRYEAMYHQPLEAMARAAKKIIIIRGSFSGSTKLRYLPDVLLEPGFQSVRAYFHKFSRNEIQKFLESEGFIVTWIKDWRQQHRFDGKPEVVGGIDFLYEFLVAERVRPIPSEAEVLGDYWEKHAKLWTNEGKGIPFQK